MSPGRQRWTLIAACFAQFMILLDVTIVNVALPSIQRGLDMTAGSLVWTINAYVLPLASLILVGGTLGDRYGRKRVFALGFALFTLFSAGCALSTSDHLLLAFRALQGVGAALLAPLSLSILVDAFEPARRPWAIGIWATIAGFGFGLGPVLGGVLIEAFDWSAIFWVNVPIGLAGLAATLAHVRESRDPTPRRLDLGGAALGSAALFCLTLALVETDDHAGRPRSRSPSSAPPRCSGRASWPSRRDTTTRCCRSASSRAAHSRSRTSTTCSCTRRSRPRSSSSRSTSRTSRASRRSRPASRG